MNNLNILKDLYSYYTTWNLNLIVLYHLGYLKNYYYDILFSSIYVSCISFIFTYITPRKLVLKVDKINYTFKGKELIIFDLICHHIPLIYMFSKKKKCFIKDIKYLFVILPLIYKVLLNDNYDRYGINDKLIFTLYFFVFIFYYF